MLLKENELLSRFLYEPIWRFFESIHDCIVDCVVEAWDWIVEKLRPYALFVLLFNLAAAFLLLVTLLRGFFQ